MTAPRDLRLERLSDRDSGCFAYLGEFARVASPVAEAGSERESQTAREVLNNAVYTAHGATEWLCGLRRVVAALLRSKGSAPQVPVARDAIFASDARSGTC